MAVGKSCCQLVGLRMPDVNSVSSTACDCSYSIQALDYGIAVRVSGFSDKVPVSTGKCIFNNFCTIVFTCCCIKLLACIFISSFIKSCQCLSCLSCPKVVYVPFWFALPSAHRGFRYFYATFARRWCISCRLTTGQLDHFLTIYTCTVQAAECTCQLKTGAGAMARRGMWQDARNVTGWRGMWQGARNVAGCKECNGAAGNVAGW